VDSTKNEAVSPVMRRQAPPPHGPPPCQPSPSFAPASPSPSATPAAFLLPSSELPSLVNIQFWTRHTTTCTSCYAPAALH